MYNEMEQILVLRDGRCQEAQPPACNPTTHARSTGVGTVRVPLPKTELRSRSCAKNDVRNTIVSISIPWYRPRSVSETDQKKRQKKQDARLPPWEGGDATRVDLDVDPAEQER